MHLLPNWAIVAIVLLFAVLAAASFILQFFI
jgi:hypothetical protein